MTEVNTKLERDQLIQLIQNRTKWSEHSLRAFKDESLQEIYRYIVEGYSIHKAKVYSDALGQQASLTIPKAVERQLGLSYGDWFGIETNIDNRELILDASLKIRKSVKLGNKNRLNFPLSVIDRNLLRKNDDVVIRVDGEGRLILKSFTFYQ